MNLPRWRYTLTNAFGTLGYLSGILQWVWTAIILCYPIVSTNPSPLFPAPVHHASPSTPSFGAFTPVVFIAALLTTLLVLALTVITLIKLPKTIGTSGAKTTHTVAKAIIPTVTHHKKIPKKQYLTLSYRIVLGLKYIMTVLPFVLLALAPATGGLSTRIIMTIGVFTTAFTLFYFSIQAILVEVLRVDKKKVW